MVWYGVVGVVVVDYEGVYWVLSCCFCFWYG